MDLSYAGPTQVHIAAIDRCLKDSLVSSLLLCPTTSLGRRWASLGYWIYR